MKLLLSLTSFAQTLISSSLSHCVSSVSVLFSVIVRSFSSPSSILHFPSFIFILLNVSLPFSSEKCYYSWYKWQLHHLCDLHSRHHLLYKNTKQTINPTKTNKQKTPPQITKPTHNQPRNPKSDTDTTHPIFFIPACVYLDINFRTNRNNLSNFTYFLHHCQLYQHVSCLKLET